MSEIALIGWGAVSAAGAGLDAQRRAWEHGAPATTAIDRSGGYHRANGARRGLKIPAGALDGLLSPRAARRMSPPSRFAVAAARLALEQASLDDLDGESLAVVSATAYGPSSFTEALLRQIVVDPTSASPMYFTEAVANAPAAQVALAHGALGPNLTVTQRDSGALSALGAAARIVRLGRAERALVVAVDELDPLLHAVLDRFGGSAAGDEDEVARPYDAERSGFVTGEGATAWVLERTDRPTAARRLGVLRAQFAGFDPDAPASGWSRDPERLAACLLRGLKREGIALDSIDAVVGGASGSRTGDRLEAGVLRRAWADRPLPTVVTPKAWFGEWSGAVLLGAALLAEGSTACATPGFQTPDPTLGLRPHIGGPLAARRLLVVSFAPGGAAAFLVFDRSSDGIEGSA
ncbi:MAG: beta-ketoacyl synthase N-terminal-like domain-containing protein [Acidobacteriota bacterium]